MLRKLIAFAITSGLAAKLFKAYTMRQRKGVQSQRSSSFRSGR